jgi:hypothetical protein
MTEHKDIQKPDDYTDKDYDEFEMKLFSQFTSVDQLEEICMTLAHLPTKRAQELLEKFSNSERASEVGWLEGAMDEGQFHYLSPTNEQEERDYLALKVMQEIEDEIVDLHVKYDELKLELDKREIEYGAILELIKQGELHEDEALGFQEYKGIQEKNMEELAHQIAVKEKTFDQIKKSVKTEKYKDVDMMYMRHIHF